MAQILRYITETDKDTITICDKDFKIIAETTPVNSTKYEVYHSGEIIDGEPTATIGFGTVGRLTIPKYVRDRCNFKEDTRFLLIMEIREDAGLPNRIIIEPITD